MPAKKATGIEDQLTGSGVEARELLVHEPLELRVERLLRLVRRSSPTAPRADQEPDDESAPDEGGEREQPGEQAEPAFGRSRQHLGAELARRARP